MHKKYVKCIYNVMNNHYLNQLVVGWARPRSSSKIKRPSVVESPRMSSGKSSLRKKNSRGGSDGGGTIAKVLINSIASMGVKEEDDQTDAKPVNVSSIYILYNVV